MCPTTPLGDRKHGVGGTMLEPVYILLLLLKTIIHSSHAETVSIIDFGSM